MTLKPTMSVKWITFGISFNKLAINKLAIFYNIFPLFFQHRINPS